FSAYSVLIMAGLIFSLGGDIALMLPHDRFVMGLGSFLIAQIIYTFAFISRVAEFSILLLLPLIAYGIWMFF
ncbi:MAG: lysoplasmalogenase, partial [Candidatus Marinimicrobia bacterium CG_4_9_14_3_um_filter_48_9]